MYDSNTLLEVYHFERNSVWFPQYMNVFIILRINTKVLDTVFHCTLCLNPCNMHFLNDLFYYRISVMCTSVNQLK